MSPRSLQFLVFSMLLSMLSAQPNPEALDFFEKKIRPVLVGKCYSCHSANNEPMGGLRLDSRIGLLKGGNRGAAVKPGNVDDSLLIRAIRYGDLELKMPPAGKLTAEEIGDFETWVRIGVPDPRTNQPESVIVKKKSTDIFLGRDFWAFRPLALNALSTIQTVVENKNWATSPIDYFILSKLEKAGLSPAAPAHKNALIRRVTFDLLGLPPSSDEITDFLDDNSANAFEKLVDRLLASPHYGERWGRHWLDLVRFAETNGHEYDNDKLDAWRYRDYVIRAFNDDIPYDQFVKEHIAGDLLTIRRVSNDGNHWEAPIATGFYWFGEVLNSPTDSVKAKADRVENQIDVFSKAFLGLTIACARCHDHKFDPIPTADYYSLAGIFHSTALREASIDSGDREAKISTLRRQIGEINDDILVLTSRTSRTPVEEWKKYLKSALRLLRVNPSELDCQFDKVAEQGQLDRTGLQAWLTLLQQASVQPDHPLYPLVQVSTTLKNNGQKSSLNFTERLNAVHHKISNMDKKKSLQNSGVEVRPDILYEDFSEKYTDWVREGLAFSEMPTGQIPANQRLANFAGETIANSFGSGSNSLMGSLTTPKFKMPRLYVHIRMAGTPDSQPHPTNPDIRVTIDADGHKSQVYTLTQPNIWQWVTRRMTKEIGRTCYIEIVDRSSTGHIVVDKIVFSDSEAPPWSRPDQHVIGLLNNKDITSLDVLIDYYAQLYSHLGKTTNPENKKLLAVLSPPLSVEERNVPRLAAQDRHKFLKLRDQRQQLETQIPESVFAMISIDENPRDIAIHQRGNHKTLGQRVPRRFLQVIAGENQKPYTKGSGRLQLAESMVSSQNPLLARVLVNRLWKHHFGSGIVATLDNFGKTGKRPTHPQLLDYLAGYLVENEWSLKAMHRLMLTSSTYRMASRPSNLSKVLDPENKWLQHNRVRRLEAEAVRDSILTVSGSLDNTIGGPGIAPFVSDYPDHRGKPRGGPIDGSGRRSIYLQVRRNFINPIFLAFDYPPPISTMGRRGTSTVTSQALMMLNNKFVRREAELWADRLLTQTSSRQHRITTMFQKAFGRAPDKVEVRYAEEFLNTQQEEYTTFLEDDPRIWADLAHVLFNSSEFIFLQ